MTISYRDMTRIFGRIGCLSFGGPAAQIALMEDELVSKHHLMDQDTFLRALSFCMLLPGPEAMQLATYAGWRLRGVSGGLLAGMLFVVPGAAVIFGLAAIYLSFGTLPWVQAAFIGVQATVIVIVLQALMRIAQKGLSGPVAYGLATFAFLGLFAFGLPFPLILLVAAGVGAVRAWNDSVPTQRATVTPTPAKTLVAWALAWVLPIALVWVWNAEFLTALALFFAKLAVVTFGGAYAVLAYMTQQVVTDHGWITTQQMIDALGLAETTPGPLILVTQFVGTLAGHGQGGWAMALLAGGLTLWVTFVPCFLWIFAGAPYLERLTAQPRINGALKAITAAVVGVILNLSIWFALHVFFADLVHIAWLGGTVLVPVATSLNILALGFTVLAAVLLLYRKWPLPMVLLATAIASVLASTVSAAI